MTIQEKEALLNEILKLPEPDQQYILGWCARATADKKSA